MFPTPRKWWPHIMLLVALLMLPDTPWDRVAAQGSDKPTDKPATTPPALPESVAEQVEALEARIAELEERGLTSETRVEQDAVLDEAITLARRVLTVRIEHQGSTSELVRWRDCHGKRAEWYELVDARLKVKHLQHLRQLDPSGRAELASLVGTRAEVARLHGEARHAEEQTLIEFQLDIQRRILGHDHPHVAASLNNLAYVLQCRGALAEAEPLHRDALAMVQRLYPGDHPHISLSLNNLAGIRRARGALAEAESLYRDALAMDQRLSAGDHSDVVVGLNNLAFALECRGAAAEAETLYRDALAMAQRLFPGDHLHVATCLNNLAGILEMRGALAEAEPLYRDALAMYLRLFPGDHPYVAFGLNNLACVLKARGELAEAEPLCRNALALFRRRFPGDHPDVATCLNNLAGILMARGALTEAGPLFRDALAMRQRLFPGDHPDLALSLSGRGRILSARGELAEAEPLYRDALAMCLRLFPGDHPDVAFGLNNLAYVLKARGELAEAEPLYRDALAMYLRLFPGDHPHVATSLNNMAGVLEERGSLAEAEPLYRDALAMLRRLFPGDHPQLATSSCNLAAILETRGSLCEAESLYQDAFEMSERLRTQIIGGEQSRAEFAEALSLSGRALGYAGVLVRLDRRAEVLAIVERGRARAALDLLERSGHDLAAEVRALGDPQRARRLEAAQAAETQAQLALTDAENLLAGRRKERAAWEQMTDKPEEERKHKLAAYDQEIVALVEDIKQKGQALTRAGTDVLVELRGLFPAARPLATDDLLRGLAPDEAVVCVAWGSDRVLTAIAARGQTTAEIVAEDQAAVQKLTELADKLRAAIAARPDAACALEPSAARDLLATLLPESLRALVAGARRLVILPDGPLNGIPFDVLMQTDPRSPLAAKEIIYAPSATVYLDRRGMRKSGIEGLPGQATAVLLGNPVFNRDTATKPQCPQQGVLLAMVQEGSNAADAGLKRGDVLLRYGEHQLSNRDELGPAIQQTVQMLADAGAGEEEARVSVAYWRDGETAEARLRPGRMGVVPQAGSPADGLRTMKLIAAATRSGGSELAAGASATEQVRLFGGVLPSLPGTAREVQSIANLLEARGADHSLLTGADATVPRLWRAVSKAPPRYLHLATHGLMGSADAPYDAGLALTQPDKPTPEDIGFLTLKDLIGQWGGKLDGCELVVLSACDTQRGVRRGDTVMSLPLGFFFAGARTVIASLWKVDDTATRLLMVRLYENLLGQFESSRAGYGPGTPMPKAVALQEAQRWLRDLTYDQVAQLTPGTNSTEGVERSGERRREVISVSDADRPFEHPYYWAAFVLIGAPD